MYFLDTSALAKRYMVGKGTPWIKSLPPTSFIVSAITYAEIYSALARRVRGGTLLPADQTKMIRIFDYDMERRFRVIDLTRTICQHAGKLAEKHGLRAYDSIQLACVLRTKTLLLAVRLSAPTFLAADADLVKAASSEGLVTDNPENH